MTMSDKQAAAVLDGLGTRTTIAAAIDATFPANAHTMPVMDIQWDERWLDKFPDLTGQGFRAAVDYLFAAFRTPGKDHDRHALLHRQAGAFVSKVRAARNGKTKPTREAVKATQANRDLANWIAQQGITAEQIAAALGLIGDAK